MGVSEQMRMIIIFVTFCLNKKKKKTAPWEGFLMYFVTGAKEIGSRIQIRVCICKLKRRVESGQRPPRPPLPSHSTSLYWLPHCHVQWRPGSMGWGGQPARCWRGLCGHGQTHHPPGRFSRCSYSLWPRTWPGRFWIWSQHPGHPQWRRWQYMRWLVWKQQGEGEGSVQAVNNILPTFSPTWPHLPRPSLCCTSSSP